MAKSDGTIIIDTSIDTSGFKESITNFEKQLAGSTEQFSDFGESVGKKFAEGFNKEIDNIGDVSSKLPSDFGDVENKINKLSESAEKVGAAMTLSLTTPITIFGKKSAEAAAVMKAEASQFSQVFGDLESNAFSNLSAIADETGIIEERLRGSYTQIASFAKTTGIETEEAMELSNRAMRAVADSAAFYDRSVEETAESLRSFLKGNYENDAALGLSATEYTRNAAAMELYGQSFNDLSESQKQFTLLKMVEDANELSGALGQAARESEEWSNVTGNLDQEMINLQASIGQHLLPVLIPLIQNIAEIIGKFADLDPKTQKIIVIVGAVIAAIGPIATLIGGITTAINFLVPIISLLMGTMGPIVIIIGAVIAAIILLIKNWDDLKANMQIFDAFLQKVFAVDFTRIFGPVLGGALNGFFYSVSEMWKAIKKIFSGIIDFIVGIFTGDWERAWNGVKDIFTGIWDLVVAFLNTSINVIIGVINGLISGVVDGINAVIRALNSLNFTVPDWIPGLGRKSFGFDIRYLTAPQIPYLATGAVIPPNAPFTAVLGDQKNGRNLEAPEDLIRKIVREESVNAELLALLAEIAKNTRDTADKDLIIGDRAIARANARGQRAMGYTLVTEG